MIEKSEILFVPNLDNMEQIVVKVTVGTRQFAKQPKFSFTNQHALEMVYKYLESLDKKVILNTNCSNMLVLNNFDKREKSGEYVFEVENESKKKKRGMDGNSSKDKR